MSKHRLFLPLAPLALTVFAAARPALAADRPASLPPPPPPSSAPSGTTTTTAASAAYASSSPSVARESYASSSSASGAGDRPFSAAAMLGFGTDQLNFGLGLRASKLVTDRISIGGLFVYHFGDSQGGSSNVTAPGVSSSTSYSTSYSLFYVGPEAGYDIPLAPVLLRPYAGLGLASISASSTVAGVSASASSTKFVFWPGCQVIYDLAGTNYFVAGDVRFVTVPGGPSFGAFASAGMKL